MTAPFSEFGMLGARGVLVAGFVIGVAFGACLERAGLGSARKLMGQFSLRDLAVFKVMFSAIVTAMLGAFWLSKLGVLDLGRVYLPETFLVPQLIGGAIFGIGFALAGLCPGTSCVAAATGRGDGIATMIGMFAGVLATGVALPSIATFFTSTSRGGFTIPSALGVSEGVVVLGIVAIALAGFALAPRVERYAASKGIGE
ncbi:MAG: YeeE/YedE thiosulfate transporter family protein [bacterium]